MAMAMLTSVSIFITFFSLPAVLLSATNYSSFIRIQMPPGVTGPSSAGFDIFGQGPYVTVEDGRILKWQDPSRGFVDFAYTSPNRTKELCDYTTNLEFGPICGRPLALSFHYTAGILYIADAYYGLLEVGLAGGLAKPLATSAEGVPFKLVSGVDVDLWTGMVYFSDASTKYDLRDYAAGDISYDSTGRFMEYNPYTGKVRVLMGALNGGGGPVVSSNGRFVFVPEFSSGNVYKYWLIGPKAKTYKQVLHVSGNVNKIKRGDKVGEYWVATTLIQTQEGFSTPQGLKINWVGKVLQNVSFEAEFFNKSITTIQEHNRALYVGSRFTDFIGRYA